MNEPPQKLDLDSFKPYWRNSERDHRLREYTFNGAIIDIVNDELRLKVVPAPRKFLIVFACLFLMSFVFLIWHFAPEPTRWFILCGGVFAASSGFAIIWWLTSYHESLGDFLVIRRDTQTISLPRSRVQYPFEQVIAFQWFRGRSIAHGQVRVDLNLLAKESGEIVRHHIMGFPSKDLVDDVIRFSGIRLELIDLGHKGYRDADKSTLDDGTFLR